MNPIIRDTRTPTLGKIQLVACLQDCPKPPNGEFYFFNSDLSHVLHSANQILRLSTVTLNGKEHDLIELTVKDSVLIFLGHWNSGTI